MKIRTGFVSNSSSSSYIIGVGKLINEEEFVKYCKENQIRYDIMTTKKILDFNNKWTSIIRKSNDKIFFKTESFDGNEVSVEINPNEDEKFVSVHHYEDISENEDGELNYDVHSDSFDSSGQAIFNIGSLSSVKNWECSYGAGRNG